MRRLLVLACSLPLFAFADSAVPQFVVHQGRLLEGETPASGQKKLKFAIYEDFQRDPTSPKAPIWTDTYTVKFGEGGVFSVVLGDTAAGDNHTPLTLEGAGTNRFLAIEIESIGELTPRLRLSTTPYAILSRKSELAADVACAGCVGTDDVGDKAVTGAKIGDGAVDLTKLAAALKNDGGKLDADTLDGKDSAAFAPASIEAKVDDIKASVGAGLAGKVDTIASAVSGTLGTDATAIKSSVGDGLGTAVGAIGTSVGSGLNTAVSGISTSVGAGLGANVTSIKTSVGDALGSNVTAIKTSVGDGAAGKLDKLMLRLEYSKDCKDSWVATAWGTSADTTGYEACMRDGRWHLVYDLTSTLTPASALLTKFNDYVQAGASVRVTTATGFGSEDCVRVEPRSSARIVCVGPLNEHPYTGKGPGGSAHNFHLIGFAVDTDARIWHTAYLQNSNGSTPVAYSPAGGDINTWGMWVNQSTANGVRFWTKF